MSEIKDKSINYFKIIKTALILIAVSLIGILIFATVMYFLEGGYEFSPLFATVSVALGCLLASLSLARSVGKKGFLIGGAVGFVTFIILTLIALVANDSGITVNALFRFIIIMLASIIGGIIGVNKKQEKYI